MEATIVYWGNIGIMEKEMEATIVYWGNIGIMENKMEATVMGLYWVVVQIRVLFLGTLNIRCRIIIGIQ